MAIRYIGDLQAVPVVDLEPAGMFDGVDDLQFLDPDEIQRLFRRAVPAGMAKVPFVPGSEKLISLPNLMPHLGDIAGIITAGVSILADMEIAGGYAFLGAGEYAFGAEGGATLEDVFVWEQSVTAIKETGRAKIQHAYDAFFEAELNPDNQILSLRHNRTGDAYQVPFNAYAAEVSRATGALREFAVAIVPELEKRLKVADRRRYAIENFRHHPEWFDFDPSRLSPR
jgi:hypothetical protein